MGNEKQEWTPEGHLNLILTEAVNIPCDSGKPSEIELKLPPWFDVEKFKRGQKFYKDNMFSLFVGMLSGLLVVLAVPSILRILVFTGRSSTSMTAYRRYVATILHTVCWFDVELTDDARSWQSLAMVRKRHLSSSQSACKYGVGQITQKDMTLTQFGFMGFMIARPKYIGLLHTSREDREAFVHFWRCISYVLGIEDRFSICRSSLEDTEAICELLIKSQFRKHLSMKNPTFDDMSAALLSGVWTFNPFLTYPSFMFFLKRMVGLKNYHYLRSDLPRNSCENNNILTNEKNSVQESFEMSSEYIDMHWFSKLILHFLVMVFAVCFKYSFFRWYFNSQMSLSLFLIRNFPFLGFHRFGFKASYVDIRIDSYKEKGEL